MRLNGWQKLGVVLSLLWAVVAGLQTRDGDVERADNFVKFAYKVCKDTKMLAKDADLSSCEKERLDNAKTWMKDSDKNVAFAALVPIPFGWLAGFILLYGWRVQVAGFRATVPWATLPRPKKGFVVFCFVALGAGLLLATVAVMNLYVDTQVPVALSPFADVMQTDDGRVRVTGTWTRHEATGKSAMGYPLQTSTINCIHTENRCIEARASVAGNVLTSELVEHDVQSWTKESIVIKDTDLCAEEVYTIDLNTKSVSGAGHRINGDKPLCKLSPAAASESEWTYRMDKGFPVYWDQRTKARPWPLRIIQSFFGN